MWYMTINSRHSQILLHIDYLLRIPSIPLVGRSWLAVAFNVTLIQRFLIHPNNIVEATLLSFMLIGIPLLRALIPLLQPWPQRVSKREKLRDMNIFL